MNKFKHENVPYSEAQKMEPKFDQRQPQKQATMQTRSTNTKILEKDGKDLAMENYLTVTATINFIVRKLNLKIYKKFS